MGKATFGWGGGMEFSLLDIVLFLDGAFILGGLILFLLLAAKWEKVMRTKMVTALRKQRLDLASEKRSFESATLSVGRRSRVRRYGRASLQSDEELHASSVAKGISERLDDAIVELEKLENEIESAPPCEVLGVDITTRNIGRFAAAMSTGLLYTVARQR